MNLPAISVGKVLHSNWNKMDEFHISAVTLIVDIRVQYKSKFYVVGKEWKCIFGELYILW